MVDEPGRACPLAYRTTARTLRHLPPLQASTLYVVGGLYGNFLALDAIIKMAEREICAGLSPPVVVFNGDFNWFNAERRAFERVNETVLRHTALAGNVELELGSPSPGAGCGCAYPAWVDGGTVSRSNRIMERLQAVAAQESALRERLRDLPVQLRVQVGQLAVGVLHGDPDSVAGWGLALETIPSPGTCTDTVGTWFAEADVDVFACTHTCVAYMQDFAVDDRRCLVMNNGSAGMPNFRGDLRGLISRISVEPSPLPAVYGITLRGVHCDALAVAWPTDEWQTWFETRWPAQSPAERSYGARIREGAVHDVKRAFRVTMA